MQDNTRKITKIVDELMYYVLKFGSKDIHIDIRQDEEFYYVSMNGIYDKAYEQKMLDIEKMLKSGLRDKSIEAEYWELMGLNSASFDSELQLIGMMVHSADVVIGEEKFQIEIVKRI